MTQHIQHCFGDYEKAFCDGDPKSDDIAESLPCSRRDVCQAFRLYLEEDDREKFDYFDIEKIVDEDGNEIFRAAIDNVEEFLGFCGKLVDRYGTYSETIKKKRYRVVEKPVSRKKRGKHFWKQTREQRANRLKKARTRELVALYAAFRGKLEATLPVDLKLAREGEVALPGQLYAIKKIDVYRHSSISLWLRGYGAKDLKVVELVPRYATKKLCATIFLEKDYAEDYLDERLKQSLGLQECEGGCQTKPLDLVGLSLLVEALAIFFEIIFANVKRMISR